MKFLKRWFARKCREAWEDSQQEPISGADVAHNKVRRSGIGLVSVSDNPGDSAPTVNFSVVLHKVVRSLPPTFMTIAQTDIVVQYM
jgi:hypothetical protein